MRSSPRGIRRPELLKSLDIPTVAGPEIVGARDIEVMLASDQGSRLDLAVKSTPVDTKETDHLGGASKCVHWLCRSGRMGSYSSFKKRSANTNINQCLRVAALCGPQPSASPILSVICEHEVVGFCTPGAQSDRVDQPHL